MQYVTVIPRSEEERKASIKALEEFHTKYRIQHPVNDIILSDLSPCLRLLTLLGTFSLNRRSLQKESQCYRILVRAVEGIIHIFWMYVFIISTLSTIRIARQLHTSFTLCLMNVITVIIRFIFHLKKDRIHSAIHSIEQFYHAVTDDPYKPMKSVLVMLSCGCVLAAFAMGIISSEHLRAAGTFEKFAKDFVFGLNFTSDQNVYFRIFTSSIFTATLFYHHFLPVAMCIFICSMYVTFKRAINAFENKIKEDRLRRRVDIDVYISLYKIMMDVLSEVEDLLSAITFFMYGCLLANQLCVITQIIAGGGMLTHPASVLMEFVISIKNITIFFSITLIGSSISQAMDDVRNEIKHLPAESSQDFEKLSLVLQGVCSAPATLTAWKMFNLKRGLILTTASVMITYSMLLLQFSQQNRG